MANNDIVDGFDDEKDENLKITIEGVSGNNSCLILDLAGRIDTYNSMFFQKRVQKAIESGFICLVFRCEALDHVSSTGVGSFTAFLKTVKPQGGDMVFLGIQPKIYEVFQLLGFSQIFNIRDNLEDAVDFFYSDLPEDSASVFPKVLDCPVCSKKLKAQKAGRFRCAECMAVLSIDSAGQISLG
ncbi:MAG: STAS domain-containing protein [Treponema sp.]|nr:STAS domain-containing protein [Treponema sp.]